MPKEFNQCVKGGGKVRTIKHGSDEYQHVCVRPGGKRGKRSGRTVSGEVKTKKGGK